jgi:hypothetical protein
VIDDDYDDTDIAVAELVTWNVCGIGGEREERSCRRKRKVGFNLPRFRRPVDHVFCSDQSTSSTIWE